MLNSNGQPEVAASKPRSRMTSYGLATLIVGVVLSVASLTVPALYNGAYGLYCLFVGVLLFHVALVLLIVGYQLSLRDREDWDIEQELD